MSAVHIAITGIGARHPIVSPISPCEGPFRGPFRTLRFSVWTIHVGSKGIIYGLVYRTGLRGDWIPPTDPCVWSLYWNPYKTHWPRLGCVTNHMDLSGSRVEVWRKEPPNDRVSGRTEQINAVSQSLWSGDTYPHTLQESVSESGGIFQSLEEEWFRKILLGRVGYLDTHRWRHKPLWKTLGLRYAKLFWSTCMPWFSKQYDVISDTVACGRQDRLVCLLPVNVTTRTYQFVEQK